MLNLHLRQNRPNPKRSKIQSFSTVNPVRGQKKSSQEKLKASSLQERQTEMKSYLQAFLRYYYNTPKQWILRTFVDALIINQGILN